jgi:hypothetical protein
MRNNLDITNSKRSYNSITYYFNLKKLELLSFDEIARLSSFQKPITINFHFFPCFYL